MSVYNDFCTRYANRTILALDTGTYHFLCMRMNIVRILLYITNTIMFYIALPNFDSETNKHESF